jgi:hypothetical protein
LAVRMLNLGFVSEKKVQNKILFFFFGLDHYGTLYCLQVVRLSRLELLFTGLAESYIMKILLENPLDQP